MVQPAADQGNDRDHDHPIGEKAGVESAPSRLAGNHEIGRRQPDGVRDPIPMDDERADREGDRVRNEVDHTRQCPMDWWLGLRPPPSASTVQFS